mmetsp:Transcript_9727/g.22202  ORF Transcript_9727/g.22202 Transcript_9727/m.22202 type:complete len:654 (-) Transcript_9727:292-2253(-)
MTFLDEEKRDKHKAVCVRDLLVGLVFGAADPVADPAEREELELGANGAAASKPSNLYRGKKKDPDSGTNAFVAPALSRVPVLGDPTSLHARGARERTLEDKKIAKENAMIAAKLDRVRPTVPGPRGGQEKALVRSRFAMEQARELKRVEAENQRLGKSLRRLYKRSEAVKDNYGGAYGSVRVTKYYEGYAKPGQEGRPTFDQSAAWEARTQLYTKPGAKVRRDPTTPKTLSVVQCAGCARRHFFGDPYSPPLRRCAPVHMPLLKEWNAAGGLFGDQVRLATKLLGLVPAKITPASPVAFGGDCCKALGQTPNQPPASSDAVPWYCDDACAVAGWLSHRRACAHRPKLTGHGGLAALTEAPWVDMGSRYRGGVAGELRRLLRRAAVRVKLPSGQVENGVDPWMLSPVGAGKAKAGAADSLAKGSACLLRRVRADGSERLVKVEIVDATPKPDVRALVEHLGSLVLDDPDLLKQVTGPPPEEAVQPEGIRCFYCYDALESGAAYEQHVRVCAMRWRRIEALKPPDDQRPEPERPTSVARPGNVDDREAVLQWSAAAKEAMGAVDGYNPNGGGALGRMEQANMRADARAAREQLEIALNHMDSAVLGQIQALDKLQRRIAWEGSGGASETAVARGAALDSEIYGPSRSPKASAQGL